VQKKKRVEKEKRSKKICELMNVQRTAVVLLTIRVGVAEGTRRVHGQYTEGYADALFSGNTITGKERTPKVTLVNDIASTIVSFNKHFF